MKWVVGAEDSGLPLLAFLAKRVSCSKREIKRLVNLSQCKINGRVEKHASTRVGKGMKISFQLVKRPAFSFEKSRLLYENNHFIAYDKPPFVSSEVGGIVELLSDYVSPLYLVHRLDKLTSGVILLAKDEETCQRFEESFRKREMRKTYLTVVDGKVEVESGVISEPIDGKSAETAWECVERYQDVSLVRCFPKTGRTHQIRLHMLSMGHPIIGDTVYCRSFVCKDVPLRHLLHASSIAFDSLTIEAPLPEDMAKFIHNKA